GGFMGPAEGGLYSARQETQHVRRLSTSGDSRELYELSVICQSGSQNVARPTGLEPVTFGSGGRRSIQLSYGRKTVDSLQSPIVKRSRQSHSQVAVVRRVVPPT